MKPVFVWILLTLATSTQASLASDWMYELQSSAVSRKSSLAAHWGTNPERYSRWKSHSNRLIPVYTYGTTGAGAKIDLDDYLGDNSVYRDKARLQRLYQGPSLESVAADAVYMDQTNIFDLQLAALEAGKKYIFLVVFDGMDWQTTRAASIWNLQCVAYDEGRGTGSYFQDYTAGGTSQFGWMVTSPSRDGAQVDVNDQSVKNPLRGLQGGYSPALGGMFPWSTPSQPRYLLAGPRRAEIRHAYTDSASSATSMTAGIKTYNSAINVGPTGEKQSTIAHRAQSQGYRVGAVTSVPISHATPAAAYAHNVSRNDYQDLTRDLLGLPSISHPEQPLPGMDVVIGAGHGVEKLDDDNQGENFVPGNVYLTDQDLTQIDIEHGGAYVTSVRTTGVDGGEQLLAAAQQAAQDNNRLFAFYGLDNQGPYQAGHLPYASANGDYRPAPGVDEKEIHYSEADVAENPTLAEMTTAALTVLAAGNQSFWLMVESGDVDWANHSNNLDASIGAVNSGDAAVRVITDWVETHSNWDESIIIVTADHGHYLVIDRPELLFLSEEQASAAGQ